MKACPYFLALFCSAVLALDAGCREVTGYAPGGYFSPPPRIGLYLGGYYQPAVMPLDDIDYLKTGQGWMLYMGYSADTMSSPDGLLGLEVAFGRSLHENKSTGNTAAYTRLQIGLRWWENTRNQVMPYLTMGTAFHDIDDPGGIDADGWGFYGGGGVDILPSPYAAFGVDVRIHIWGGEDRFGVVTYGLTPVVSVGFTVRF